MTYKDIIVQILSEATGKPIKEVTALFETIEDKFPIGCDLSDELSNDKAETLFKELWQEKTGIVKWLVDGKMMVEKNTVHAQT